MMDYNDTNIGWGALPADSDRTCKPSLRVTLLPLWSSGTDPDRVMGLLSARCAVRSTAEPADERRLGGSYADDADGRMVPTDSF